MAAGVVENIIDKFDSFTRKPVKFLTVQVDAKDDIKNLVKSLYDFTKSEENDEKKEKKSALPELIVHDFDEEQIWQEIELQNTECWDHLVWDVANCISAKDALLFPVEVPEDKDEEIEEEGADSDDAAMSEEDSETENQPKKKKAQKQTFKSSIVDDQFFKLKQMEQFLLKEEKGDGKADVGSDDESIDMFDDMDSEGDEEEGGKEMMYGDFFDEQDGTETQENPQDDEDYQSNEDQNVPEENQPKKVDKKKVKFAGLSSDDNSDSDDSATAVAKNELKNLQPLPNEKKSDFELRQQRLQQTIARLEQKNLNEAPWQLKGEIDATRRPQNSLLQEVVDFDLTSRPAPIITEQTTVTLEDIIKQRIKDKAWDDVVKKAKPVDDQLNFRKQEVLDQAKSKLSLAQVYEAEYLKQKQALSGEVEEEKEPEEHTKIREAMSKLFSKLDALSHYHYTPKPPQAEVKIISNTPAISMEEVAPVATSDAALLAPEEIKRKRKGELISKDERTQSDKNRERRKKKKLQRKKGNVEKVTEHRNTSKGIEANDKTLKTSKAFFQQLNDDSTSLIKKKKNIKNKGQ
ncbi:hypothetical protein O0L34_g10851 [Tuta absoluta]|nr:hypothetical protein O0L34_g10851 [Tuta absoluta]